MKTTISACATLGPGAEPTDFHISRVSMEMEFEKEGTVK